MSDDPIVVDPRMHGCVDDVQLCWAARKLYQNSMNRACVYVLQTLYYLLYVAKAAINALKHSYYRPT